MSNYDFEFDLIRSRDDAPPFSREYQQELAGYATQFGPHSQTAFTMDSVDGGGGPLGEFAFGSYSELIKAVGAVAVGYIAARAGRKVKVKSKDLEVEARNPEEVKALLLVLREHEAEAAAKAPAANEQKPPAA